MFFLELTLYKVFYNVLIRLLGTRFTNAVSCFKPGPQGHCRDIFVNTLYKGHRCTNKKFGANFWLALSEQLGYLSF
jgi:hypothetical protein